MKKSVFYIPCYPKNTKTYKIIEQIKQSILLCDRSGFEEAFFGEHIADKHEKISSSLMIAASLALMTKNKIRYSYNQFKFLSSIYFSRPNCSY